jgi:hypothetical protein
MVIVKLNKTYEDDDSRSVVRLTGSGPKCLKLTVEEYDKDYEEQEDPYDVFINHDDVWMKNENMLICRAGVRDKLPLCVTEYHPESEAGDVEKIKDENGRFRGEKYEAWLRSFLK